MHSSFTLGTALFLEALAKGLERYSNIEVTTLPADKHILTQPIWGTPFELIGNNLSFLGKTAGGTVGSVIDAMGINAFICPGSGRLVEGYHARLGLALGIGSARKGHTMNGLQIATAVRGVIVVLPTRT